MAQKGCFSTLHPKDQRRLQNFARRRRDEIDNFPAEITLSAPSVRRGTVRIRACITEEGVQDARTGYQIL